MKRSRFTEEQIIAVLKEQEAGVPVAELCRQHGVSDATFSTGRPGMRSLESENAKLKRLLADAMLDNAALKNLLAKNVWPAPSARGLRSDLNRLR